MTSQTVDNQKIETTETDKEKAPEFVDISYVISASNFPSLDRRKKYVFELTLKGTLARITTTAILEVMRELYAAQVEPHPYNSHALVLRSKRVVTSTTDADERESHLQQVLDGTNAELGLLINRVVEFVKTHREKPKQADIQWLAKPKPAGEALSRVPRHIALSTKSDCPISPGKQRRLRNRRTTRQMLQRLRDDAVRALFDDSDTEDVEPATAPYPA